MTTYLLITKASKRECWASARIDYPEGAITCIARAEADLAKFLNASPAVTRGRVKSMAQMQTQKSYQGMAAYAQTFQAPP